MKLLPPTWIRHDETTGLTEAWDGVTDTWVSLGFVDLAVWDWQGRLVLDASGALVTSGS